MNKTFRIQMLNEIENFKEFIVLIECVDIILCLQ